jgi:hypothetical protein
MYQCLYHQVRQLSALSRVESQIKLLLYGLLIKITDHNQYMSGLLLVSSHKVVNHRNYHSQDNRHSQ